MQSLWKPWLPKIQTACSSFSTSSGANSSKGKTLVVAFPSKVVTVDLYQYSGVEFNWTDALNLESRLTEDEIMMRYIGDGVLSLSCDYHMTGKEQVFIGPGLFDTNSNRGGLTWGSQILYTLLEWSFILLMFNVTEIPCQTASAYKIMWPVMWLCRDQVRHYCQEKLMPRILMANRHESKSLKSLTCYLLLISQLLRVRQGDHERNGRLRNTRSNHKRWGCVWEETVVKLVLDMAPRYTHFAWAIVPRISSTQLLN